MRGVQKGGRKEGRTYGLSSRGDSFSLGEGVRHQEPAFITKVSLAVKTRSLGLAALAGPRAPRPRAGAWSAGRPGSGSAGPAVCTRTRRGAWSPPSLAGGARLPNHARPRGTHASSLALASPGGALQAGCPRPPGLLLRQARPREAGLQQPGCL